MWAGSPLGLNDPYDVHIFIEPESIRQKAIASVFADFVPASELDSIVDRIQRGEDYVEMLVNVFNPQGLLTMKPGGMELFRLHAKSLMDNATSDIARVYADLRAHMGVSSFSERVDSPLMWAHYANSHKGYCVEYDFSNSNMSSSILPVIYQDEIFECSCVLDEEKRRQIIITALVKSKDWEYEKEWRMVVPHMQPMKSGVNVKVPTPKAVYLGSHIIEEDRSRIIDICNNKGVEVFQMIHSQNNFKMIHQKV